MRAPVNGACKSERRASRAPRYSLPPLSRGLRAGPQSRSPPATRTFMKIDRGESRRARTHTGSVIGRFERREFLQRID